MSNVPSTFADFIFLHARLRPSRPAIILHDRVATYEMLAKGIRRVEGRIRALGLPQGALVSVALAGPIRQLIVTAALFRLGHPSISTDTSAEVIRLKLPVEAYLHAAGEPFAPGLRQVLVSDQWFTSEPDPEPKEPVRGFPDGDAICRVEITSGSTGLPKPICSTLDEFNRRMAMQNLTTNLGAWDRLLALARLGAPWGFRLAAQTLVAGKTLVVAESAPAALQMTSVYNVEAIVASTQQARDLVQLQKANPIPCPSLRSILFGGGLPSRGLLTDIRAYLCQHAFVQYGASEAGLIAIGSADNAMEPEGATGFALPGAEIQIVDATDQPMPTGADGVVRVRTEWLSRPFPPGSAHPGFRDGWFYPGDAGRLTDEGLLILNGRVTEVINAGGVKRAPEAIEDIVSRHPDIGEVAAFGAMSPDGIEAIQLAIVTQSQMSDESLIAWCEARGIEVARVYRVASIPRTPLGKIRRDELRKALTA